MEKELEVALRKFNSAKEKMRARARGKHTSVGVSCTLYRSGAETLECSIYKAGVGYCAGSTWEKAFQEFEIRREEMKGA